jgi:hypothetical protein
MRLRERGECPSVDIRAASAENNRRGERGRWIREAMIRLGLNGDCQINHDAADLTVAYFSQQIGDLPTDTELRSFWAEKCERIEARWDYSGD